MADKKTKELSYGQLPVPVTQKGYALARYNWSGLNMRQDIDTGALSSEMNISTSEAPYLVPSRSLIDIFNECEDGTGYDNDEDTTKYDNMIAMFAFEDFLIVIYNTSENEMIDYIKLDSYGKIAYNENNHALIYTGIIGEKATDIGIPRSMVQFNVYSTINSVTDGSYVKRLILFPEKKSLNFYIKDIDCTEKTINKQYTDGEITDTTSMYCAKDSHGKRYYVYDRSINKFVANGSGDEFSMASLDVTVKKYYNDGYIPTADKVCMKDKDYYTREENSDNQYVYTKASALKSGDYVAMLYEKANDTYYRTSDVYAKADKTYYYYASDNTYKVCTGIETASELDNTYFEKTYNAKGYTHPQSSVYNSNQIYYIKNSDGDFKALSEVNEQTGYVYNLIETHTTYDSTVSYFTLSDNGYKEITWLKSGDDVSGYFTREDVDLLKDIESLYIYTDEYYPPDENADKGCYYQNTYNSDVYSYNKSEGWRVCSNPAFPNLKYATVHLSRLFGVDDDRVYVSGYNDYTNWNLDTVTESLDSNAWVSTAQSNTKADGVFSGIATYDNHVVCFKHDYMHEIYNNKNPFRIQDIYAEGCIDNRSIQEVDGKLIFASSDGIKIYTGGNPKIISFYLGIDEIKEARAGTDGRYYYLFCLDGKNNIHLFTYDTIVEQWSEQALPYNADVLYFAHNKCGTYMLCDNGTVYRINDGDYDIEWRFETDLSTSITTGASGFKTVNIKHIRKIQLYADFESGSEMKIYALYDGEKFNKDTSQLLWNSENHTISGKTPIRIRPRKTANYGFRLYFEGHGYIRLYSMEIYKEQGGELYE